jgi:hypothetical protein
VLSDANVVRALDQADGELARGEGEGQESLAAAMAARRARRATAELIGRSRWSSPPTARRQLAEQLPSPSPSLATN